MGLQLDEAVDHLHPRRLHRPGQADIGFLIEPGPKLDHGGDRLTRLGRFDQRLDDGAITASAIERLLHRDHVGIGGGLAQELDHHVETLERMVDDDVLGPDGGKAIAREIADALGEARGVGREQQIRAVVDD